MNENGKQKIIINNINLKKKEYPKDFYQEQYYLDILINGKISSKSPLIKFNQFSMQFHRNPKVFPAKAVPRGELSPGLLH